MATQQELERWERIARHEGAEQERLYRENLESAIDKLDASLAPGRHRPRALSFEEMKALRQFIRKFHNS